MKLSAKIKRDLKNCSNEGTAGPNSPIRLKNTVRLYIIYGVAYTCIFLCRGYVHV